MRINRAGSLGRQKAADMAKGCRPQPHTQDHRQAQGGKDERRAEGQTGATVARATSPVAGWISGGGRPQAQRGKYEGRENTAQHAASLSGRWSKLFDLPQIDPSAAIGRSHR